jgi:ubiquitin-conjugating enzyme E2 variant
LDPARRGRPELDPVSRWLWAFETVCLLAAGGLLMANLSRLAREGSLFAWWTPLVVLAALLLADFASGIVHWGADTWGSEQMPVLGSRFLRPFRVHHLNPDDILRRGFVDLNGDVALLGLPLLAGGLLIPLSEAEGRLASVFCAALGACSLPTNQIHQWAHRNEAPVWVRWLQRSGLILSRERHALHHAAPYTTDYCITTGWCNPALARIGFFRRLERWISRATGAEPRSDEAPEPQSSPLRNRVSAAAAGRRMAR